MTDLSTRISPALRVAAEGRLLAPFLTESTVQTIPEFAFAEPELQASIRTMFATVDRFPRATSSNVRMRHVEEGQVIRLLAGLAPHCGGPFALNNLVGFEWVEIQGIIAGHYLAAPMPLAGRFPGREASVEHMAAYCLVGSPLFLNEDIIGLRNRDIIVPEALRLSLKGISFTAPNALNIEYLIDRPPSPITVLLVEDRVIAISHQERLIALLEAGVTEALCLVCFGYGLEALRQLPTVEDDRLHSARPPMIEDFISESTMVRIPVYTPRTLIRFRQEIIDLALLH